MPGPIQSAISNAVGNIAQTALTVKAAELMEEQEKQKAFDVAIGDTQEAEQAVKEAVNATEKDLEQRDKEGDQSATAFYESIQEKANEKAERMGMGHDQELQRMYREQLYAAEKGKWAEESRRKIYQENPYYAISRQYRLMRPSTVKEAKQFLKARQEAYNKQYQKETK